MKLRSERDQLLWGESMREELKREREREREGAREIMN